MRKMLVSFVMLHRAPLQINVYQLKLVNFYSIRAAMPPPPNPAYPKLTGGPVVGHEF